MEAAMLTTTGGVCIRCLSDDLFSDEYCWECYDWSREKGWAREGKQCQKCHAYIKTQFGNYRRHRSVCKGKE